MEEILSKVRKIHLIGIGGVGMSGLALLLNDRQFVVSGSDIKDSANTHLLVEEGIKVFIGHDSANITSEIDLIVHSSAIKSDNPELIEARSKSIDVIKRGKLLAFLCKKNKTIAVSGSHGKTTTTSLLAYALSFLGCKPAVFLGGLPLNYSRGAWWGDDYFVVETDESDGSFLDFDPWISIITNIDKEHLDYYKTFQNLEESFLSFGRQTKKMVFGCCDYPNLEKIVKEVSGISYGLGEENTVRAMNFSVWEKGSCFDLYINKEYVLKVKLPLLGKHNCLNALAVFAVLNYLGLDLEKANQSLADFKGTKRRFQIKEEFDGITFIDDYAHHPTEIRAVISAAKLLKPKRLFVIVQPHRFSRIQLLKKDFANCFTGADLVVISDIYAASETKPKGIDANQLFKEANKHFSGKIEYIPKENLKKILPTYFKAGDVVLALGAGDINMVMEKVIDEFKKDRIIKTS